MKKFVVNCDFGGQIAPFSIYIGSPESGHHPLHFQSNWLSQNRGGAIPQSTMEAISKLQSIAAKNNVLLEDLCTYAIGAAQQEKDEQDLLAQQSSETDSLEGGELSSEASAQDAEDEVISLSDEEADGGGGDAENEAKDDDGEDDNKG